MANDNGLGGFAARLNSLCDEHKLPVRGRAEQLRKIFSVSREAARKWLAGQSYPTITKRAEICRWGNCTDSWLMTGKGDRHPVTTDLSDEQRLVIELMRSMTKEQQALALRLVSQLAYPHDPDPLPPGDAPRLKPPGDRPGRPRH